MERGQEQEEEGARESFLSVTVKGGELGPGLSQTPDALDITQVFSL